MSSAARTSRKSERYPPEIRVNEGSESTWHGLLHYHVVHPEEEKSRKPNDLSDALELTARQSAPVYLRAREAQLTALPHGRACHVRRAAPGPHAG